MIRVQQEDFDIGAEIAKLRAGRTDIGAIVSFTGSSADATSRCFTSNPARCSRRQPNTTFAFTPLRSATADTDAPGSLASSTILSFSCSDRN